MRHRARPGFLFPNWDYWLLGNFSVVLVPIWLLVIGSVVVLVIGWVLGAKKLAWEKWDRGPKVEVCAPVLLVRGIDTIPSQPVIATYYTHSLRSARADPRCSEL